MINFLKNWAESTWDMMVDSAFLLLLGLVLAGLISLVLNTSKIKDKIKGNGKSDVFWAALLGIPLPLCSCSVLPVVQQLRKSGVSRGGAVSFLISTPESGIDSIMLTYTLTDPIMTVARPVTAFITAASAGLLETAYSKDELNNTLEENVIDTCENCCAPEPSPIRIKKETLLMKAWKGIKYSFTDLLSDLAPYLLFGYLLAGLVSALLGGEIMSFSDEFITGWGSYVAAIVIGVPLYICATSSTPLAAALLVGGFSPGAVLVFMMVGPATNIASLTVMAKILKGWSVVRYLLVIIVVSVLCGIAVDFVYEAFNMATIYKDVVIHQHAGLINTVSAVVLSAMIIYYSLRKILILASLITTSFFCT